MLRGITTGAFSFCFVSAAVSHGRSYITMVRGELSRHVAVPAVMSHQKTHDVFLTHISFSALKKVMKPSACTNVAIYCGGFFWVFLNGCDYAGT